MSRHSICLSSFHRKMLLRYGEQDPLVQEIQQKLEASLASPCARGIGHAEGGGHAPKRWASELWTADEGRTDNQR